MVDGVGYSAEDILERESGGLVSHAIFIADLGSALEGVYENFKYDETAESNLLCEKVKELMQLIEGISLDGDGALTFKRSCSRCSGRGASTGEDPCRDCAGKGYVELLKDDNASE